jgi:hypothetical protein
VRPPLLFFLIFAFLARKKRPAHADG